MMRGDFKYWLRGSLQRSDSEIEKDNSILIKSTGRFKTGYVPDKELFTGDLNYKLEEHNIMTTTGCTINNLVS